MCRVNGPLYDGQDLNSSTLLKAVTRVLSISGFLTTRITPNSICDGLADLLTKMVMDVGSWKLCLLVVATLEDSNKGSEIITNDGKDGPRLTALISFTCQTL
jgi:hypothetical protein